MLGLGFTEILVIAVVVLVFVGPDRLPEFMKVAGRIYGQVRRAGEELRTALTAESNRQESEERYQKMLERRRQAEEVRKKAAEIGAVPQDIPILRPTGDRSAEALIGPQGVQLLPPEEDPELPMIRSRVPPMPRPVGGVATVPPTTLPSPPPLADPPPGVTQAEWAALPAHIRDILRNRA